MTKSFIKQMLSALFLMAGTGAQAGLQDGIAAYQQSNYTAALKELRPLADNGDAKAQTFLGDMYGRGKGVPQNHVEAASWYRKVADQGYAEAQTFLGVVCKRGIGVAQDDKEAMSWYHKAAEQGYAEAHISLADCTKEG